MFLEPSWKVSMLEKCPFWSENSVIYGGARWSDSNATLQSSFIQHSPVNVGYFQVCIGVWLDDLELILKSRPITVAGTREPDLSLHVYLCGQVSDEGYGGVTEWADISAALRSNLTLFQCWSFSHSNKCIRYTSSRLLAVCGRFESGTCERSRTVSSFLHSTSFHLFRSLFFFEVSNCLDKWHAYRVEGGVGFTNI